MTSNTKISRAHEEDLHAPNVETPETPPQQPRPRRSKYVLPSQSPNKKHGFLQHMMETLFDTVDDEYIIGQVRSRLIGPIISSVLSQLYPYILFISGMMLVALLVNFACCIMFIMHHVFRPKS